MLQKKHTILQVSSRQINLLFVFGLFAIVSCVSKQFPEQATGPRIEFGHGGGFAGIEYRFILLEDGRLFAQKEEEVFISKLTVNQVDQLFQNVKSIVDLKVTQNNPGNTYQYIQLVNGDNHHRWVWNSLNQANLDPQLKINYSILTKFVTQNETSDNQ